MNIKDDFVPYRDGNNLRAPNPVLLGVIRGSDNGPMFTSEYYIMLNRNNALTQLDRSTYDMLIKTCVSDDQLHRAPGDTTEDAPDDYYGVYSGYVELGLKPSFKLPIGLWRQPQLLHASLCAADNLNPFRFILSPISALIIATSCMFTETSNTDARRLSWHLINATKGSFLCRLASKLWYKRLYNDYGPLGMRTVAAIYYLPHGVDYNPYSKWWVS